jgi:GTPase Era involved in 16S rRNA processing
MGEVGCGKTTIFNKVCDTNFEAGWSADSLTRGLVLRDSAHSYYPFTLIDTPGTNSTTEAAKHAILLKEGFTCQPVNAIFVVIPNHNRPSQMLEKFDDTCQPILSKNYKHLIVLVVSHFDSCTNPNK